jgi:hypothetical protein
LEVNSFDGTSGPVNANMKGVAIAGPLLVALRDANLHAIFICQSHPGRLSARNAAKD